MHIRMYLRTLICTYYRFCRQHAILLLNNDTYVRMYFIVKYLELQKIISHIYNA